MDIKLMSFQFSEHGIVAYGLIKRCHFSSVNMRLIKPVLCIFILWYKYLINGYSLN